MISAFPIVQVEGLGVICRSLGMAYPPINLQVQPQKLKWMQKLRGKIQFLVLGERVISSSDCKDRQQRRLHKVFGNQSYICINS